LVGIRRRADGLRSRRCATGDARCPEFLGEGQRAGCLRVRVPVGHCLVSGGEGQLVGFGVAGTDDEADASRVVDAGDAFELGDRPCCESTTPVRAGRSRWR